jgi:hypothetical protein
VLAVGFFVMRGKNAGPADVPQQVQQETTLPEIALADRPIASLTPTSDGHFLNLKIDKIKIPGASTMDYEMTYQLSDGRTQGAPGTITLNGQTVIERKLLLGSESSGKFRYDEGVKEGNLTIRFRNSNGKLVAKFTTQFALLSGTKDLATPDGKFTVALGKIPTKTFFVLMETFGVPNSFSGNVTYGPYGLFSSADKVVGLVNMGTDVGKISIWDGSSWVEGHAESTNLAGGIFVGTSK